MRTILVDTGPLVALCDDSDALHERSLAELDRIKGRFLVCLPVLTEAHFLLPQGHLRQRLAGLFTTGTFQTAPEDGAAVLVKMSLAWLARYKEHEPDFTDAFLVAWAERERHALIWTFDREFSRIWRTTAGKKLRLA